VPFLTGTAIAARFPFFGIREYAFSGQDNHIAVSLEKGALFFTKRKISPSNIVRWDALVECDNYKHLKLVVLVDKSILMQRYSHLL
jgi:hypothetical protein